MGSQTNRKLAALGACSNTLAGLILPSFQPELDRIFNREIFLRSFADLIPREQKEAFERCLERVHRKIKSQTTLDDHRKMPAAASDTEKRV